MSVFQKQNKTKRSYFGEFPGGPVVRTPGFRAFTALGPGSTPGQGTKILQAVWRGPPKNLILALTNSNILYFHSTVSTHVHLKTTPPERLT